MWHDLRWYRRTDRKRKRERECVKKGMSIWEWGVITCLLGSGRATCLFRGVCVSIQCVPCECDCMLRMHACGQESSWFILYQTSGYAQWPCNMHALTNCKPCSEGCISSALWETAECGVLEWALYIYVGFKCLTAQHSIPHLTAWLRTPVVMHWTVTLNRVIFSFYFCSDDFSGLVDIMQRST